MKKILIAFIAVAIIAVGGYAAWALTHTKPSPSHNSALKPGPMSVDGEAVCLPHKAKGDAQTLECAFGLRDENGDFYGLKDPQLQVSQTTKRYRVTGQLETPPTNEIYDVKGIITVDTATQL